jgi:GH3 auxin-responsive promoter
VGSRRAYGGGKVPRLRLASLGTTKRVNDAAGSGMNAMLDGTSVLRIYARWRLGEMARQDPVAEQEKVLRRLLARAGSTRFHRDHRLAKAASVADYQSVVPLRRYEDFWNEYWRERYPLLEDLTWPGRIPFFANTSGTSSGITKRIPVSTAMAVANRRAAIDLLVHHVANRPQSRVLAGRNFMLGGSTALERVAPGVAAGDLSGIAAAGVPWWAKPYFFPSGALGAIADWEEKTERLAELSLRANIRSLSGTPSWLLPFFDRMRALRPGSSRLVDWYPGLEMVAPGGISFAPYRKRFAELMEGSHAETREVYPASEGFIAVADRGPDDGLRLLADNGLFFEFVPLDELSTASPTRHWLGTAQTGINYALVVTSCAGLWSYILGDPVRFVRLQPPRLVVTGRTSYSLSAFGEHLIGEEIDKAVTSAAAEAKADVADFTVGPVYPAEAGRSGHHLYVVEFTRPMAEAELRRFAQAIDRELATLNKDYADHRAGDFGMRPPEVRAVAVGSFVRWMKARGKLGGQNKVPRIIADPTAFQQVIDAIARGD